MWCWFLISVIRTNKMKLNEIKCNMLLSSRWLLSSCGSKCTTCWEETLAARAQPPAPADTMRSELNNACAFLRRSWGCALIMILSDRCVIPAGCSCRTNATWKAYRWTICLFISRSISTLPTSAKKMTMARGQPNASCYQYLCPRLVLF